jgi:NADP-dependent 3-hydroxy acid dehydrogenase YdfG
MLPTTADNLFGVHGLVAVITGGATGIGYMMAKGLIGGGAAKVYILGDRRGLWTRLRRNWYVYFEFLDIKLPPTLKSLR